MKRAEIEEQIEKTIEASKAVDTVGEYHNKTNLINSLTDLFLQLSDLRCEEQRRICYDGMIKNYNEGNWNKYSSVLNAPLPTL